MNKNPKTRKTLYIVSIVLAVFVLTTSIGYGLFSKSLSIHGVATTLDYYSGTKLPHTPYKKDTKRNLYYTSNYDDGYNYNTADSLVFGMKNALVSENWGDDTYTIVFDKKLLGAFQNKEIVYRITFTNPTVIDYTDGVVTTTTGNVLSGSNVSTAAGTITDIQSASAVIDKTTLNDQDGATVTVTTQLGTINYNMDSVFKFRIGYRLYSGNNGMRYLNFIVKYDSTIPSNSIIDDSDLPEIDQYVTKVDNGYFVNRYPATIKLDKNHKIITDLKSKLEPGATYRIIRDYEGARAASSGMITIRNSSGTLVSTPAYPGLRYKDFTLTQEEIDSITSIYVYGSADAANNPVFTFFRIIKISD